VSKLSAQFWFFAGISVVDFLLAVLPFNSYAALPGLSKVFAALFCVYFAYKAAYVCQQDMDKNG
jgi:uncharacterized membrane protein